MAAAYVQGAANGATTGTTLAVSLPGNITVGNQLMLHCRPNNPGAVSVADDLGNTWTAAEVTDLNAEPIRFFRCKDITTGGACTITVTFPTSTRHGVNVREFSGLDNTSALDDSAGSFQAVADTSLEMGSVDTTAAGVLYNGANTSNGATISTPATNYGTVLYNATGRCVSVHRISTGALSAEAPVHTISASETFGAIVAAVAEASGGGGGDPEGRLIWGKLIRGGLLRGGVLQ